MKRMVLASGLALALGLTVAGLLVVPQGLFHARTVGAADDPAALSDLRLGAALTQSRLSAEIDQAIATRDTDLTESLIALAAERGLSVAPVQRERLRALNDGAVLRTIEDFGHGFVAGDREGGAAFAGALAGDITGFGDLRDLASEGRKWLGGEDINGTVLAIAAAGLAISAATWVSLGGAMPARNGLSAVKAASKARLLSPALSANMAKMAAGALDRPALSASLAAAGKLDLAGARLAAGGIVKPAALAGFRTLGRDAGAIYARTGQRGLTQVLAVAEDAGDIGKAARLGAAKGTSTRGVLKVLGRGALVLGALGMNAVGWLFALVGYALALAMLAQRLGWWLGRRLRRRKAPRGVVQPLSTARTALAA